MDDDVKVVEEEAEETNGDTQEEKTKEAEGPGETPVKDTDVDAEETAE